MAVPPVGRYDVAAVRERRAGAELKPEVRSLARADISSGAPSGAGRSTLVLRGAVAAALIYPPGAAAQAGLHRVRPSSGRVGRGGPGAPALYEGRATIEPHPFSVAWKLPRSLLGKIPVILPGY